MKKAQSVSQRQYWRSIRQMQILRAKRDMAVPGGLISIHLQWMVEHLMEEADKPEGLDRGTFFSGMRDLLALADEIGRLEKSSQAWREAQARGH